MALDDVALRHSWSPKNRSRWGSGASTAGPVGIVANRRHTSPAAWISTPRRKRPGLCGPVTASTSPSPALVNPRASAWQTDQNINGISPARRQVALRLRRGHRAAQRSRSSPAEPRRSVCCVSGSKGYGRRRQLPQRCSTAQIVVISLPARGFVWPPAAGRGRRQRQRHRQAAAAAPAECTQRTHWSTRTAAERGYVDAAIQPSHTAATSGPRQAAGTRSRSCRPKVAGNVPL